VYRHSALIAVVAVFGSVATAQPPAVEPPPASAAPVTPFDTLTQPPGLPTAPDRTAVGSPSLDANVSSVSAVPPAAPSLPERLGNMYRGGFILVDTQDPLKVPFLLRMNVYSQFRYLNQQIDKSFTDAQGNVRRIDPRNDFSLNRQFVYLNGFAFTPKLTYNLVLGALNTLPFAGQGGFIAYEFDKLFKLNAGYWGVPGSRSLTGNFMFLQGVERSLADNFFRPGFTQGIWAQGQTEKLNYVAFVGNGLNTLTVNQGRLDSNFVYSGSAWWEPLAPFAPEGPYRTAFSDLEMHEKVSVRLGASFTGSREDRFTNNDQANPENVALFNSDGTLLFGPGSLAPGVTVQAANYYMLASDVGLKYQGLALNGQYFLRWLNSFRASGPLPVSQTFDHGFEASAGQFVVPKTLELYARTSLVFGQFRDSNEYAFGVNYHPIGTRNFRVIAEAGRVQNSPVGSVITPYQAGQNGWNFTLQTQLFF
jgi:hypothetical protein